MNDQMPPSDLPPMGPPAAGPPPMGPPAYGPPTGSPVEPLSGPPAQPVAGRARPWWGFGDVLLGMVIFFIAASLGTFLGLPFTDFGEVLNSDMIGGAADLLSNPAFVPLVVFSILTQQVAQVVWPLIVSRWKGLGAVADWRLGFTPSDLWVGIGTGIIGLAVATVVGLVLSEVVGLVDDSAADNTQILTAAEGTPWLWLMIFLVVVGAPVSEELFFRGLTLRAIEKRAGTVWAVILSSLVFALPHFMGSGLRGSIVLLGTIFVVGLVLGAAAVITDRLAAPIVAHMVFNGFGVIAALGVIDVPA